VRKLMLIESGDIEAFSTAGGGRELTEKATAQIAAAELAATREAQPGETEVLPTLTLPVVDGVPSTHHRFAFKEVEGRGLGAFATQEFHRGDLILADQPLFFVDGPDIRQEMTNLMSVVQNSLQMKRRNSSRSKMDTLIASTSTTQSLAFSIRMPLQLVILRAQFACLHLD